MTASAGGRGAARERQRLDARRYRDVLETSPDADLDPVLALVTDAMGAVASTLVLIDGEGSWLLGSGPPPPAAAIEPCRALARSLLVDGGRRAAVVVDGRSGRPTSADPALTLAAHAVRPSGQDGIGAVVVTLPGDRHLDEAVWSQLASAADHLAHLLELRARVDEYRRFVELSPDPVVLLDLEGTIEQANPAFHELLGVSEPNGLLGRSFLELVAGEDRVRITPELARVLFARRRSVRTQLRLLSGSGQAIPCSVSVGHLRGVRRHLQLVVHDLSERLEAESRASRLSEQLARAQRLDAVGQVAGGLAHDLNNLLVVMVSNLGLAMESLLEVETGRPGADLSALREDLDELQLAVDRAGDLTSKLLQFARRDTSPAASSDVGEVVDAVQALVARSLGDDVTLRVGVAGDLPPVAADPVELERVLVNLVINGRDALAEGGNLTIDARLATSRAPHRHTDDRVDLPGESMIRIEVADDGVGMDAATRSRAFEPLFTTKSTTGGSGLGLATVLAFADAIGGDVHLDSQPGRGTRVSLWLPVGDPVTRQAPAGRRTPVAGPRIVLVDPGDRTRRVIVAMLQGAGYRVEAVATGEDAIDVLGRAGADLLITELALPTTPGSQLLEIAEQRFPGTRTMALASVDAPRVLGSTPVLVKPFSHTRLLRTVERLLRP